jgi:hypothetical protein
MARRIRATAVVVIPRSSLRSQDCNLAQMPNRGLNAPARRFALCTMQISSHNVHLDPDSLVNICLTRHTSVTPVPLDNRSIVRYTQPSLTADHQPARDACPRDACLLYIPAHRKALCTEKRTMYFQFRRGILITHEFNYIRYINPSTCHWTSQSFLAPRSAEE